MNNKYKKIIGIVFILGVLVLSFWYGGDAPGLQGFSINAEVDESEDNADAEALPYATEDGTQAARQSAAVDKDAASKSSDTTGSSNQDIAKKEKKAGYFQKIFMKVKRLTSSKKTEKNNPQLNKKAQKNANRAESKSEKKLRRKKRSSQKTKDSNTSKKDTVENNTDNTESNNNGTDNRDNDADKSNNIDDNTENDDGTESDSNAAAAVDTETDDKSNSESAEQTTENSEESVNDDTVSITCTIYISCESVLNYMDKLTDAKKKIVPQDGVILQTTSVTVKEGATVFDVLQKAARDNKVHLEFNYTPAYKTYYIEGIGNLYQFDAGNLSGWMYNVNGVFPGVGCSSYKVKDGDEINWVYTCSFGKDVGDYVEEK